MPLDPKKIGKKLQKTAINVAKEVKRTAEKVTENANISLVNAELHGARTESTDINEQIGTQYIKISDLVIRSQETVSSLQSTLSGLERDAKELKEYKEMMERIRTLREGDGTTLALAERSLIAIQEILFRLGENDILNQAQQECGKISNAPKATDYSSSQAKNIANAALDRLRAFNVTVSEALKAAIDIDTQLQTVTKPALETALQAIRQALVAQQAAHHAAPVQPVQPAVPVQQPSAVPASISNDALLRQLADLQAEIASLRMENQQRQSSGNVSFQSPMSLSTSGSLSTSAEDASKPKGTLTVQSGGTLNVSSADALKDFNVNVEPTAALIFSTSASSKDTSAPALNVSGDCKEDDKALTGQKLSGSSA